jgi:hypothetical protein
MIRAVAAVSLVALLVLMLYVPAVNPPSRFMEQLRAEHEVAVVYWGSDAAWRMLDQAVRWQAGAADASPLPAARSAVVTHGIQGAVASEMDSVQRRLFRNAYFRSVDAVLMLASYRLAGLCQWLPWLAPLGIAASLDGAVVRIVKSKEFKHHDPELFALWCCLLIVVACGSFVLLVVPTQVTPATLGALPAVMALLAGLAVGAFHKRAS